MWRDGLVDEVERLLPARARTGVTARRALGYAQALAQLAGDATEAEAIAATPAAHPPVRTAAGVVVSARDPTGRSDSRVRRARPPGSRRLAARRIRLRRLDGCRRPLPFTKGHGTGNDFVILPDPDGALDPDRPTRSPCCATAGSASARTGSCGWSASARDR